MYPHIQETACFLSILVCLLLSCVCAEKLKICVVDGRGGFKRSGKYCPTLDLPNSQVECILGMDRLDCLRRISKGTVDFSVFTPEDLVTAANSEIEILITNELRFTEDTNEYEVVAIVNNNSGIKGKHDLEGKNFCHPGYGYETDWTRILSNYLEASIVPQDCESRFTITENRILASSRFFKKACKAGPWVNNPTLDEEMKRKYPNLCALCDQPSKCSTQDKYWGRRGSLFCLTDGAGDISWARLDDVNVHFGLVPGGQEATPDGYSFLCPDGSIKPINSNSTSPCIWVVKPWSVIASRRNRAAAIQDFIQSLSDIDRTSWQSALLSLIKSYHSTITKIQPMQAIEDYLGEATGFLNANSFTGCHPPRTIRICTTSVVENSKCSWLRESAAVYGIEPDLECLKADNTTHCMTAVNKDLADIVMVTPDKLNLAVSKYDLKTIFYETVNSEDKYLTVAVVKSGSNILKLSDLKGKKACFPESDGVGWNSAVYALHSRNLIDSPSTSAMAEYFGPSCVPGLSPNEPQSLTSGCKKNYNGGEYRAIRCLISGDGDVAFISRNSLNNFLQDPNANKYEKYEMSDFDILCENKKKPVGCHLSWSPIGQAMVSSNKTDLWMQDTLNVFLQLDNLFGKDYRSLTTPFQLFGPFDGHSDVLFHDNTVRFRNVPAAKNMDHMDRFYEDIVRTEKKFTSSSSNIFRPFMIILYMSCLFILIV